MDYQKAGFVYVAQMEGHDYYKIGRTNNLDRRIGQISPQMPGRLVLVFAHRVGDAWRMERVLHGDFEGVRLNGEWFRLSANDLREIQLALLTSQALSLVKRLHSKISQNIDEMLCLSVLGHQAHVLQKAAIRADRRKQCYFDLHLVREDRGSDCVLNAEFVG